MGKAKKIEKKDDNKRQVFWMSMFLLVIMVMAVAGFALSMTGGGHGGSSGDLPSEVPFQEFQDPNSGQVFWGAIKGGEQFVFLDINGFQNESDLAELAYNIKQLESINTYTQVNFTDASSEFLIKKALKGLRIDTDNQYVLDCSTPTLVFGTEIKDENCFYFLDEGNNTYFRAEALTYYLVQE